MNYLVTGGRGYIGSHLTSHLSSLGANVVSYDLTKIQGPTKRNLTQTEGDILDLTHLQRLQEKHNFDVIVNLAANKSVRESINYRSEYFRTNVEAAVNLASFAAQNQIPVFIHASSAAVYGNQHSGKISETNSVNPQNYYGETKSISESEISRILKGSTVSFTNLRFFNVGGFGSEFVVDKLDVNILPQIAFALRTKERFKLFGNDFKTVDGSCERDFIHVLDVVESIELISKKMLLGVGVESEYNVCTGIKTSMLNLIARMEKLFGSSLTTEIHPRLPEDPDSIVGDNSRLNELLDKSSYLTIAEITESTWNAFTSQKQKLF